MSCSWPSGNVYQELEIIHEHAVSKSSRRQMCNIVYFLRILGLKLQSLNITVRYFNAFQTVLSGKTKKTILKCVC